MPSQVEFSQVAMVLSHAIIVCVLIFDIQFGLYDFVVATHSRSGGHINNKEWKMKKLFVLVLFLLPVASFAQSDHSVAWDLVDVEFAAEIELDFDVGTAYISAHGAFTDADGISFGTTGSCFINELSNLLCNLFLPFGFTGKLEIDTETLNGTYMEFDVNGDLFEDGTAVFKRIN